MNARNKLFWAIGILAIAGGALAFGVPTYYVLIGGLLLLCPLMMMFMGGHGGHEQSGKEPKDASSGMPVNELERRTRHE